MAKRILLLFGFLLILLPSTITIPPSTGENCCFSQPENPSAESLLLQNLTQPAPWPMFRYDPQHTGQSPYNTTYTDGRIKWSLSIGQNILLINYTEFGSPIIDQNKTIYHGGQFFSASLHAINSNGNRKWITGVQRSESTPCVREDGILYMHSFLDTLNAYYSNGTLKWEYTFPNASSSGGYQSANIRSSPAVTSEGLIYVGSTNGHLYAFFANGTVYWKYNTTEGVDSSPAVAPDGTIYVGCTNDFLYAIYPNGSLKWKFQTSGDIISSPAIGNDGTIYFGSKDYNVYALNPDGSLKWIFTTGRDVLSSPAIGRNGIVYIGSADRSFYALFPNGSLYWNYTTQSMITSSPAIGFEGTVYFGSLDGYLYALHQNGSLKWKVRISSYSLSPAIGSDGTIYIGGVSGRIYAIGPVLPSAPQNLTATFGWVYVNLTWDPPIEDGGSPIQAYHIYRKTEDSNFTHLATVNYTMTTLLDANISLHHNYTFHVIAKTPAGLSPPSDPTSIHPLQHYQETIEPLIFLTIAGVGTLTIIILNVIIVYYYRKRKNTKKE